MINTKKPFRLFERFLNEKYDLKDLIIIFI